MNPLYFSVKDLPAVYYVSHNTVIGWVELWTANHEFTILGFFVTKAEAESACRMHAQDHFEFA